jgi:hypothetical protein
MEAGITAMPEEAGLLLQRWRALRQGDALPNLHEFAPSQIPPARIPWLMTYRQSADQQLSYGVVGEEIRYLFGKNLRGEPVLYYADPETRALRYGHINRAINEGLPLWFTGAVLFEECRLQFGRLGLPAQLERERALLMIYFPLEPMPSPRPHPIAQSTPLPFKLIWLDGA